MSWHFSKALVGEFLGENSLDGEGTGLQSQIADITKRAGEIESLRSEFESWISASPFEREIERWPNDESKHAWPGQYRDINVALAWEAWQEAAFIHSLPNEQDHP
jgi:hypothetical protein